ncbi:MAG: hypothetical protein JST26_15520 [Bacteroidetes bacterium]|nr:hypothetical protein [Bacteroidota bacterium]
MKHPFVHIVCCLVLIACSAPDSGNSETLSKEETTHFVWPTGKYLFYDDEAIYTEVWHQLENGDYIGNGYYLSNEDCDTLFSMNMRLRKEKDKTLMSYMVKGQNDNKETEFTLTNNDKNVYIFENPFRSFPSIMKYEIHGDTAMTIEQRGFDKTSHSERKRKYIIRKEK